MSMKIYVVLSSRTDNVETHKTVWKRLSGTLKALFTNTRTLRAYCSARAPNPLMSDETPTKFVEVDWFFTGHQRTRGARGAICARLW